MPPMWKVMERGPVDLNWSLELSNEGNDRDSLEAYKRKLGLKVSTVSLYPCTDIVHTIHYNRYYILMMKNWVSERLFH